MRYASGKKENWIFLAAMGVLLLFQVAVLLFYGNQKAGFHEDELYTYYSSNKTAGLFVNDRQWMERDDLRNDFVVLPGEQFRYGIVKQMQSWDVHPPLYYYIFHTACSLFPGTFSKWTGLGVNLIAFVLCYILLACSAYMAVTQYEGEYNRRMRKGIRRRGRFISFLTCLFWGLGSAVISGVMFIRMYQWLTLFVLLCMALHLRALKRKDFRTARFLLPVAVTAFLGFLTQYYYIIFHFFLGVGFCVFLLKCRRIKELLSYGAACALGLLGAVVCYPASLSHIFRGYRGTEAVSEFGDMSNTLERLRFFFGLFDDFVMNGALTGWLLALCLLGVTAGYLKKKRRKWTLSEEAFPILVFTCLGYFFTVSKTALVLGETSNRYQLPIYGILVFLFLWGTWKYLAEIAGFLEERFSGKDFSGESDSGRRSFPKGIGRDWILAAVFAVTLTLMDVSALKNGRVFFLYEEEKEIMEFVESHREEPVVVLYNEASSDNIWWLSDELMEYPRVYLASEGNVEPIEDETVRESEGLLVYAANHENREKCLEGLLAGNSRLSTCQMVAQKGLWTLYELR